MYAELTDRDACRATDNYAGCISIVGTDAQTATTCPGGITPGSTPYLPAVSEAVLFLAVVGSGSPVSSNGFCVADSGACANDLLGFPGGYAVNDPSGGIVIPSGLPPPSGVGGTASGRCVFRVFL